MGIPRLDFWPLPPTNEVHITEASVAFAVLREDGFGQIVVELKPGQRRTIDVNGHVVTVVRDYVN